jgi:putative flavoprotein involved in K+ transport
MRHLDSIIIGAGQAGLAMSRCLSRHGLDHIVLERGRIGERWRVGSWDSLHLLTPNWMMRLPDHASPVTDPDGFMSSADFVRHLESYCEQIAAPVFEGAEVLALEAKGAVYRAVTDRATFEAPTVVIATGACNSPAIPAMADRLPADIVQTTPARYRNPASLPEGGVLVVGASSSGIQIADELHRSGRPVTIAAGRHTRLPRRYRGRDITFWLDRAGLLDERYDEVADLAAARRQPSLQLVGDAARPALGLTELRESGIRVVGRVAGIDGDRVLLGSDLPAVAAAADEKLNRLLDRIDDFIARAGLEEQAGPAERPVRQILDAGPEALNLGRDGILSVVWATGFSRDYSWLRVPVLDAAGEIRHDGGVIPRPGMYVMGLRFMRRRKSSFIDGAGPDAVELSAHLAAYLRGSRRLAA